MSRILATISQLTRRMSFSVVCVILAVLFAGYAVYLWKGEVDNKRASQAARMHEKDTMVRKVQKEPKLQAALKEVQAATQLIKDNLVDEADLADNLRHFYELEDKTKAQLPEVQQVSSPAPDKYPHFRRVAYGLRVAGTYEQVAAFLLALETGKRLVRITTFNFARADASGQAVVLDLNVEMLGKPETPGKK
jgi:Tfp pilus assembly protein PilO